MKLIIEGTPEEIAALVVAIQERQVETEAKEVTTTANLRGTNFRPERLAKDVEHMPLPNVAT